MWKEEGARNKVQKEAADIWLKILNTTIFISIFMSLTFSVVYTWSSLTTNPLDTSKPTCSTDLSPGLASTPSTGDFSVFQKMFIALEEVVRMLLVLAGVETHPGPTYRMYLIHKPLLPEPSPRMNIYCDSGRLNGEFGIFFSYSRYFEELLVKPCDCSPCSTCAPSIYLPDFSTLTVAHLAQLLESGETEVEDEEEKVRVKQLQAALGCSGISRAEKLRPQLTPGQCAGCLRYVHYIS